MYGSKFKYFFGGLLFAFSVIWIPSPAPAFADVVCTSSGDYPEYRIYFFTTRRKSASD